MPRFWLQPLLNAYRKSLEPQGEKHGLSLTAGKMDFLAQAMTKPYSAERVDNNLEIDSEFNYLANPAHTTSFERGTPASFHGGLIIILSRVGKLLQTLSGRDESENIIVSRQEFYGNLAPP